MVASVKERNALLATLTELGGEQPTDSQIETGGSKLSIPSGWTIAKAITTLKAYQESQEQYHNFTRQFRYRPWDGAAAVSRALMRITGSTGVGRAMVSFFGSQPPQLITINVGSGETLQVPWGEIEVALFEGYVTLGMVDDAEYGPLFSLDVYARKSYAAAIAGFFEVVADELRERSIYKGKAFNGKTDPEFVDLGGVDPRRVVYSEETATQLDANVWAMLRSPDVMRRNKVSLKRSVLLHGPYGTGKTLAAMLTAQVAVQEGWTFIQVRPALDNIHVAMATARLYQPAVVFFEDVDLIASPEAGQSQVTELLDRFDGINAKGTEILAILTTNNPEAIHKGMVRPGRLDALIEIGPFDEEAVEKMVRILVPEKQLAEDLDWEAIHRAMEGYLPAFVTEAVERTQRYAIARTGGDPEALTTADFVAAAHGLRPQFDLMQGASEKDERVDVETVLAGRLIGDMTERLAFTNERGSTFPLIDRNNSK